LFTRAPCMVMYLVSDMFSLIIKLLAMADGDG